MRWSTRPKCAGGAQLASRVANSLCCCCGGGSAGEAVSGWCFGSWSGAAPDRAALSIATRVLSSGSPSNKPAVPLHQPATRLEACYANRCIQTATLHTLRPCRIPVSSSCHYCASYATHIHHHSIHRTHHHASAHSAVKYSLLLEAKDHQHRPRPCTPALLHQRRCSAFVSVKTTPRVHHRPSSVIST